MKSFINSLFITAFLVCLQSGLNNLMRLDELIATCQYHNRSLYDVLRDFEKAGGEVLGRGEHGTVIWHPKWNYVFKTFPNDPPYLRYIRYVKRHQDNMAFPRVLGGPWKIVPFYRRSLSEPYLYVVKLERLQPIKDADLKKNIAGYVHEGWQSIRDEDGTAEAVEGVKVYNQAKVAYDSATNTKERREARITMYNLQSWSHLAHIQTVWNRYPTPKELCAAYSSIITAGFGAEDLHSGNFMQREDGTLVITDPVWEGETFWQMHDRQMRSEIGDFNEPEAPDEYNSLMGGKLFPKKKPKPKMKPLDLDLENPF